MQPTSTPSPAALAQREHNACDDAERYAAGAALARGEQCVASGRMRVNETQDPIRFAVMDCISNAGRRNDQQALTLYLTASPNWLEAGTIVQFGIGEIVLLGAADDDIAAFLAEHGVALKLMA